jgi:hypothetical protein
VAASLYDEPFVPVYDDPLSHASGSSQLDERGYDLGHPQQTRQSSYDLSHSQRRDVEQLLATRPLFKEESTQNIDLFIRDLEENLVVRNY